MAKSKPIALALQGGGAHGAFTWGVLDKLLEDGRLSIDAITGTSAGAMNAAVLAQGFTQNGPDGARETLETFWHALSVMQQRIRRSRRTLRRLKQPPLLWRLPNNPLTRSNKSLMRHAPRCEKQNLN